MAKYSLDLLVLLVLALILLATAYTGDRLQDRKNGKRRGATRVNPVPSHHLN